MEEGCLLTCDSTVLKVELAYSAMPKGKSVVVVEFSASASSAGIPICRDGQLLCLLNPLRAESRIATRTGTCKVLRTRGIKLSYVLA